MSTRRLLLALSNNSPFPLLLTVYYNYNLGGYMYTPYDQGEIEQYEKGSIFDFIEYYMNNYAHAAGNCQIKYGDFTLYIWTDDVEVYITEAYWDDDNIGIIAHDESDNNYHGKIYTNYGTTTLNGTTYSYSPGEIYMYRSN